MKNQMKELFHLMEILENIKGIAIFRFSHKDVVRHPLVQKIIQAYEKRDNSRQADENDRPKRETFKRRPKD